MGSPGEQRKLRIDEHRINDLRAIEAAVRLHRKDTGSLPEDLAPLDARPGVALDLADPQTGAPYEYRRDGAEAFVLCANFAPASSAAREPRRPKARHWARGSGRPERQRGGEGKR